MKKIFLVHYNSICKQKPLDLLIVADCLLNRTFVNALCERLNSNADLFYIDTSRKTRTPILIRHASYFILALKVFFLEKEYKIIIFWQQFIGLYYGLLSYLKKTERPNAFLMPFIFKQRKGALGKIHKLLFSLALRCSAIRAVICHSSCEMMYYQRIFSRNRNKIYFIPYGQSSENEDNNKHLLADKPYFFSGGTSNRDYVTLASAAAKTKYYFIIACTQTDIKGLNMPSNFKVIHDAYRKKFDSLVKECLAVIIPLKDPNISSGQIFLL